jgi:PKD repeat protein
MRTLQVVPILILLWSAFAVNLRTLHAQCPSSWQIKDACGPILANGGIAPNSPPIFCVGEIVTFLNTTDPTAGVTKVYMDWGDGTCETYVGNPPFFTHAYVVPEDSCISVPSSTYLLYMGVEKECAEGTSFHYIITPLAVMFKPVADPSPPQIICENEEALFINACNTPSNTLAVWTTSDGDTINGETFVHTFSTPGFHSVTLNVSNNCGADAATLDLAVTPLAVADAVLSDTALCLPNAFLNITNLSQGADGQIWSITPNSGFVYLNGTGPGSASPQIQFQAPGDYLLSMQVYGCGYPTWSKWVSVTLPPTIALDTIPNTCSSIVLDPNFYFIHGGGNPTTSQWSFLGGSPASANSLDAPPISFSGVGLHIVSLNISNHCGAASMTGSFYILPQVVIDAAVSDTVLCMSDSVLTVTNNSQNAVGYLWWVTPAQWGFFDAGTNAISASPVFNFTSEGVYQIHLKAFGCGNPEWTKTIRVRNTPSASLISPIDDGCYSIVLNPLSHVAFGGGQPDYINWTFDGGMPNSATGPNPPLISYPDTGHYVVQAIIGNVCGSDTLSESFTIFNPTAVSASTPVDSVCRSANSVQLEAIPSGGYWTGPGVSSGGLFDPSAGLNNAWSELIYNYGPLDCRIYDTVHLYVMSIDVEAGPALTRCVNAGEVLLSGQVPLGGEWAGSGVSADGIFDPALAGAGIFILSYTVIDANGCPNPDALQVTVNAAPEATLANIVDGCIGVSINLGVLATNTPGTSCDWTFGDGTGSTNCNPYHSYDTPGNYMVQLMITNSTGCRDTAVSPLTIHGLPDANFALDKLEGCADLMVEIINNSVPEGITSYNWYFGDGGLDTVFQPGQHVYQQAKQDTTYIMELTASNHCGITSSSQEITVFPRPQVHFASNINEGCTPLTVHFNNLSVGNPTSYRWYANGVLIDTNAQIPAQVFFAGANDSLYQIVLIAENACGFDTLMRSIVVHPNTVKAFAHVDKTIGCASLTVNAFNFSTDGYFASWDFGDGNAGVGDTVQHTYTQAGDYAIQLFVNNGCGYDTISEFVHVLALPEVSFACPGYTCYGDSMPFVNTSLNLAGCTWNFGDGTSESTMDSPFHMYAAPGLYNVTMIGFSMTTGCCDSVTHAIQIREVPVARAALSVMSGCEPFTVSPTNLCENGVYYLWDFGDGSTSTQASPTHTYQADGQYVLNLMTMDDFGCSSDTSLFPVRVYPIPDLSFNLVQSPLCVTPVTLTFQNNSANANAYNWIFGNGTNSTAINPSFNMSEGPLDIHLIGNNLYGCSAVFDTTVNIYTEPEVTINLQEIAGCAPFTVVFENISNAVNNFNWDFGNGQQSSVANPVISFNTPGTYQVSVVANNDGICFDSSKVSITVFPPPVASFTCTSFSDTTVQSNGIFLFEDHSIDAIDWLWDFGDGGTSSVQNPVHRYLLNGDKTVTLIVSSEYGCYDTILQLIKPEPFGNLFIPNTFSPELGVNGTREFRPIGIGLKEFRIELYATNGQRVWASDILREGQPTEAWDGVFEGELCPPGVYWWKCSAILANGRPWNGMSFNEDKKPIREGKLLLLR